MNADSPDGLGPRARRAVQELQDVIARHYPTATFEVSHAQDEPNTIHLTAIVDVEDTDRVLDLVIDRVVDLQVEERIPVHVIPIRTPERVLAEMTARRSRYDDVIGVAEGPADLSNRVTDHYADALTDKHG